MNSKSYIKHFSCQATRGSCCTHPQHLKPMNQKNVYILCFYLLQKISLSKQTNRLVRLACKLTEAYSPSWTWSLYPSPFRYTSRKKCAYTYLASSHSKSEKTLLELIQIIMRSTPQTQITYYKPPSSTCMFLICSLCFQSLEPATWNP